MVLVNETGMESVRLWNPKDMKPAGCPVTISVWNRGPAQPPNAHPYAHVLLHPHHPYHLCPAQLTPNPKKLVEQRVGEGRAYFITSKVQKGHQTRHGHVGQRLVTESLVGVC